MRKLQLLLIATVAVVLGFASPAGAITYGEPDAGEHPYVGFMISFVPSEPGWFSCSGTLLDEDTFLTAGHCVYGTGTDGEDLGTSGGTDVWVTFDDSDVLAGWPARTPEISEEELYAQRRTWLEANGFVQGEAIPHPDYDDFSGFPENFDVGVVELSEPVVPVDANGDAAYGELAPIGTVETMVGATGRGRNDALVETVGYGIQSVQPNPMNVESRYKSTSRIVENRGNAASSGNLHTLNNPSAQGGRGGSCSGDSGGPVFVNNTNDVVAVVSYGFSGTCHGADYSWRVDTADAYEFLGHYL
ncbi:MAG: trypsin-like serine protease [Acidimicrobiia bacterium]|nr:trypsin-like serine protease [Acidimicrobiia bacterium]